MSTFERAVAAGVVATREEFDRLCEAARGSLVDVDDLMQAIGRQSLLELDNLGLHVRGPIIPGPAPDLALVHRLCEMYGEPPWPTGNPSAAYRTAVAMERRRQGWTRERAYAEWREQLVANVTQEMGR